MRLPDGLELQLAQTAQPEAGGGVFGFLLPLGAMFLLLYALVIRPQQRQQKEQKQMLSQIQKGDQIVTSGGLHGRVTGIADDVLTVEIAERVKVKINRGAVASRVSAASPKEKPAGAKEKRA